MLPALSDEGRCGRTDLRAELFVLERKQLVTGRATECATYASRGRGELNPRPPSADVSLVHRLQAREVGMLEVRHTPTAISLEYGQFYNRRKWGSLLIMW